MRLQPSRLVAFASGKGGVGKTVCAANLAMHLAQRHRILTVDLDFGCGNLNTSLGVRSVSSSINDFLSSRVPTLNSLKTATAIDGLDVISCSYSPVDTTVLNPTQKDRLLAHLRSDAADYVFLDLGSGVNEDVLDLFASADIRVLVTGPESLALHNAFVFVKSLTYRIIAGSLDHGTLPKRTRENIVRQLYDSGDQEIGRTIERVRMRDRAAADAMLQVLSSIRIHLILNKVQESSEERFVSNLQQLTRKYIDVELSYLGPVPYDDNVKKSLNDIVPFALEYKRSPANGAFRAVASRLEHMLSDLPPPEAESCEPELLQTAGSRVASFLREAWGGTRTPPQSRPVAGDELSSDDVVNIGRIRRELNEAKRKHEEEKKNWLEEKNELVESQRLAARSHTDESQASIAALERQLRDANETIGTLQKQVRLLEGKIKLLREHQPERQAQSVFPDTEADFGTEPSHTAGMQHDSEPGQDELPSTPSTIREQILKMLLEHPWHRITIVQMEEGGIEASRYAAEIASVLSLAQWTTYSVSSSFKDNQFTGLKIIHDISPRALEGARILGEALAETGIECTILRSSFATEFEPIRLVVGRSGNKTQRTLRTPLGAGMRSK